MQTRWWSAPLLAFAMLFAETTAIAQPAPDATALKAEGDRAMDTLRYEDALGKYEAAYRVKPDPALLYNQGRALEGLGRFPEALDKLLAFQSDAPKELLSRLGDALGKNIDELKSRVATLSITVDPPGAGIRLGDRILGSAPLAKLRVNAGKAHLEITKEGFFTETLDVELLGNKDNPLEVALSPRDSRATLIVKSPIAGARVTIDGAARGQVPAEVRLAPGPHLIRVEQDGYQLSESTIDLAPLEKRPLEVPLFKRPITQEWWLWTSIGVALTGAGVGIGLALTLEESADEGSLDPGKIPVSLEQPGPRVARRNSRSRPAMAPPQAIVFWAPTVHFEPTILARVLQPLPLPQVGQAIGGKYVVERTLGEGGMGVVFEVKHTQLQQRFAVKLLRPEIVRDSEAVARFEREARAAASLTSRHVCRVTDVGSREDGTPYMVMECLEGEDLGALLERQGPLPLADVARYLLEACEAIEEAHTRGIVHRDLKPENLFLARVGSGTSVKVLDFGISKRAEDNAVNVTRTQSSLGTPLYMSPEQTRSTKHVDARTDVWSMGVILYELLSGEVPFKGETPGQVAVSVAVDKILPLRSYRPGLPLEIEIVVARALEKDASDRYPTIRAFAAALAPFAAGDTSHWSRPPPPIPSVGQPLIDRSASKPSLETATTLHVQTTQQSKAAGRWLWLAGGALAVVVLGGAFALGAARGPSDASGKLTSESASAAPEPTATATSSAATAPTSEPAVTPTVVVSASAAKTEKPIKTGGKLTPSATDKPLPAKTAPTGGPLPTRL